MATSRRGKALRKAALGKFRVPLPVQRGGVHRPLKGKGSYRRHPKHRKKVVEE